MEMINTLRPPRLIRKLYKHSFWQARDGLLRLTFDDGPGEMTPEVLDWLDENTIQGVFFLLPEHAARHVATARDILHRGHHIGLHFNEHRPYLAYGRESLLQNLREAQDRLAQLLGRRFFLCRAPYGQIFPWQDKWLAEAGFEHWLWTFSSKDYRNEPEAVVERRISRYLQAGDTVLLHDGPVYSDSLIAILNSILECSLAFTTPDNLPHSAPANA
jgi:peptidoglycan/xylan/chitin deacetylase (PgdA/CDA1 family)